MFDLVHMDDKSRSRAEYIETRILISQHQVALLRMSACYQAAGCSPFAFCLSNGSGWRLLNCLVSWTLNIFQIHSGKTTCAFFFFISSHPMLSFNLSFIYIHIEFVVCHMLPDVVMGYRGQAHHFLFGGSWAHSFVFVLNDEIRRWKVLSQAVGKC